MKNITGNNIPPSEKTAVALGIFDGIHLGHRAVISEAVKYSHQGLSPAVFTFNTASLEKKHGKPFRYIYNNQCKLDILKNFGIDYIYNPDFNDIKDMTAEEFVSEILCRRMNIGLAVCGQRFRFGKNAAGSSDILHELGKKYGFDVITIPPVLIDGNTVSSSLIRSFIADGDIPSANRLLGDNYRISAEVIHGRQLGRTIGIPTINQQFGERQLIAGYGVYATRTIIDGKIYLSVTDIGIKPTVQNNQIPLAETHIIGFSGDIYGRCIDVIFDRRLRKEMKFSSVEELKKAIENDIKQRQGAASGV